MRQWTLLCHRAPLIIVCAAPLFLACGGVTKQTGSGGAAGSSAANGGQSSIAGSPSIGSGGSANGGSANGGSGNDGSGGARVCCAAIPTCPTNEQRALDLECPGKASCHQVALCCSSIWCLASDESAGSAGSSGAQTHDCNGLTCTATQACVAYRAVGGPVLMPDAGTCPTGSHAESNSYCQQDFAYKCVELNGACPNQPISCACAQPPTTNPGVCPANYQSCSQSDKSASASAQLICQLLAP